MMEGAMDLKLCRVFTILSVGVALLWETRPAYGLAYLGLLLFFALPSLQQKAMHRLIVEIPTETCYLFPGDKSSFTLKITNPTLWPFAWISLVPGIPADLMPGKAQRPVFALSPRSTGEVSFQVTARERGIYVLGPWGVFTGGLFGIRTRNLTVTQGKTIVVFPQIHDVGDVALARRHSFGAFAALQRINPDPTRLVGLRRYQEGDQLRSIHWPATAKTQFLQVKQYEHTVTATSILFLNLSKEDYSRSRWNGSAERAISVTASLVTYLINRGEACGLVSNADFVQHLPGDLLDSHEGMVKLSPRQGTAQLTQVLTLLAGVRVQERKSFVQLLTECVHHYEGATMLLWVVPRDTPELVERARILVRRGRQVQIVVVEEVCHPELLHRPPGSSLKVFSVSREGAVLP
jgi:uncharacterized protein (DUF58 family)